MNLRYTACRSPARAGICSPLERRHARARRYRAPNRARGSAGERRFPAMRIEHARPSRGSGCRESVEAKLRSTMLLAVCANDDAGRRSPPVTTWQSWQQLVTPPTTPPEPGAPPRSTEELLSCHSAFVILRTPVIDTLTTSVRTLMIPGRRQTTTARPSLIVTGPAAAGNHRAPAPRRRLQPTASSHVVRRPSHPAAAEHAESCATEWLRAKARVARALWRRPLCQAAGATPASELRGAVLCRCPGIRRGDWAPVDRQEQHQIPSWLWSRCEDAQRAVSVEELPCQA